jgi:hypothetical protein
MHVHGKTHVSNPFAEAAARAVSECAARYGAQVHTRKRISDVLSLQGSGISDEQFRVAIKTHFDYVVGKDGEVLFVAEFEKMQFRSDRDLPVEHRIKTSICKTLSIPLFCVDASELVAGQDGSVLIRLMDLWFDPTAVKALEQEVLQSMYLGNGHPANCMPPPLEVALRHSKDRLGYDLVEAFLRVEAYTYALGRGRCLIPEGVSIPGDQLAQELAVLDVQTRLRSWR